MSNYIWFLYVYECMGGVHIMQYTCENQGQLAGVGFSFHCMNQTQVSRPCWQAPLPCKASSQPSKWLLGQKEVDASVLGAVDNLHGYWLHECACEFTQWFQVFWYSWAQTYSTPGSLCYLCGSRTQHEKHRLIWSPGWKYAERGKRENIKGKRWKQR